MMKKGRRLALSMIGAATGLLLYCGSFFAKSYLENMQARQAYESLRAACLPGEELLLAGGMAGMLQGEVDEAWNSANRAQSINDQQLSINGEAWNINDQKQSVNDKQKGKLKNAAGRKEGQSAAQRNGENGAVESEKVIKKSFGINWEKLRKINPDIIAWITVPGADISYPVVQGEDDEYYLHHSFAGEEDDFGTIFLGSGSDKDFGDSHSFLYGHNMEGNMMFANLNRYEEEEYLRECPEFFVITPRQMMRYEIFSVQQAGEQSPGFQYGHALGSKAYKTQLKMLSQGSMYDTGVSPDAEKPIVTLVTCNSRLDEDIRMTVHGICTEMREW